MQLIAKLYQITARNTVLNVSFLGISGTGTPNITAQVMEMELKMPVEVCELYS
jgi:hypothetical protein